MTLFEILRRLSFRAWSHQASSPSHFANPAAQLALGFCLWPLQYRNWYDAVRLLVG